MTAAGVLDPKLITLFDQMPGAWGCKDENSVFMYANHAYGNIIGLPHHEDCIGRTDYDMPCDTINCAGLFREQDKMVMIKARQLHILDIHPFAGHQWKAYIFHKTPLLDNNKEIVGTIFHGMDITDTSILELGSLLAKISANEVKSDLIGQNSYFIDNELRDIKLTRREGECLFYLLRGKTTKQIAHYIGGVSLRTIEDYIDRLKIKFRVHNRHELIDIAIQNGFLKVIPTSLFTKQLSIILKD